MSMSKLIRKAKTQDPKAHCVVYCTRELTMLYQNRIDITDIA